MEFIAATNNPGKLAELRRILTRMGHTVLSQREAGVSLEPEETGETFDENARIKARAVCLTTGKATIADDSGLCVDALGGAPGVHSARFCGRHGDDEANNERLLDELADTPEGERAAKFVSCVCVCLPVRNTTRCAVYRGECPGRIGFVRKGDNGFGYDPLFIPDEVGVPDTDRTAPNDAGRTYAELSAGEKDAISHRGHALALMEKTLPEFLADETILGQSVGITVQGTLNRESGDTGA